MTSASAGFFTSAVYTHHALQWLWNYTVEFYPPRWLHGRWRAAAKVAVRAPPTYAPLAWRRTERARHPRGRALKHTLPREQAQAQQAQPLTMLSPALPIDGVVPRRSSRSTYLAHVSRAVRDTIEAHAPLDARAQYRVLDLVDSCVDAPHTHEARRELCAYVSERLWATCTPAMAVELLVMQGDVRAAQARLAALLDEHAPMLDALQASSLSGRHVKQRENAEANSVYRAMSAVARAWVDACMREKEAADGGTGDAYGGTVAAQAAQWLWTHPRALALVQPPFPAVIRAIYTLLSSVREPRRHIERIAHMPGKTRAERAHYASVVALAFANRRAAQTAAQLVTDMLAHGLVPHEGAVRRVLRVAAPLHAQSLALPLVEWLTRHASCEASFWTLAMYYAELGDAARMEDMLRRVPDARLHTRARLVCAASRGDVDAAAACVGAAPCTEDEAFWLLRAHVRADDYGGAQSVFEAATQTYASERLYAEMARFAVRRKRPSEALAMVAQLQSAGIECTSATLTYLVQALGAMHLPDKASALVAWHRTHHGVKPAMRVYTALMDAYIHAGHYVAAAGIFEWLEAQHDPALVPDTSAYNTLLKAHVQKGTPVKHVVPFLLDMRRRGLTPDARTYALVVQSACDGGRMELAEELFALADESLAGGASLALHTILIHAYLKREDRARARALLAQLEQRGMEPSHITYAVLLQNYAGGTESSLHIAQELALRLVDETQTARRSPREWAVPALEQGAGAENLLVPLIDAHGKRGDVWEAERLFQRLEASGEPLSPRALTVLMNAHRAAGDVDGVLRVWAHLYAATLEQRHAEAAAASALAHREAAGVGPFQRNTLCFPLSLVIDTASRAGLHDRVVETWTRAKRDGFAFDVHNYNFLCCALVRAQRVEDALSVVQHVLTAPLPRHRDAAHTAHTRAHAHAHMVGLGAAFMPPLDASARMFARDPLYVPPPPSTRAPRAPRPVDPPNWRQQRCIPLEDMAHADDIVHNTNLRGPRDQWFATSETLRTISDALDKQRRAHGRASRDALLHKYPLAAQRLAEYRHVARV